MFGHPIEGAKLWWQRLSDIHAKKEVRGLERIFVVIIHFLHVFTASGWIKFAYDPIRSPLLPLPEEELAHRNNKIEQWILFELGVLIIATFYPHPVGHLQIGIAMYFLFEILLNLCSIVFVGKLKAIYPPTSSIERSILLFGINIIQVILIFAIFYQAIFTHFTAQEAIFEATLVLGTVGSPELSDKTSAWWWVIAGQILTDLGLLVVFLASYVGSLAAFKKISGEPPEDEIKTPLGPATLLTIIETQSSSNQRQFYAWYTGLAHWIPADRISDILKPPPEFKQDKHAKSETKSRWGRRVLRWIPILLVLGFDFLIYGGEHISLAYVNFWILLLAPIFCFFG
jgi:hypothetical protein